MKKFHFCNFKNNGSIQELQNLIKSLRKFWISPQFQITRLILKDSATCNRISSQIFPMIGFPEKISLSVQACYNFESYFDMNLPPEEPIPTEIHVANTSEQIDSMKMFIEDKLPELANWIKPQFSLVNNDYEIPYSPIPSKPKRSRSNRPPLWFQNIIRKASPNLYPLALGTEYYGFQVFQMYAQIFLNQVKNKLLQKDNLKEPSTGISNQEMITHLQDQVDILRLLPNPPRKLKFFDFISHDQTEIAYIYSKLHDLDKFDSIGNILKAEIKKYQDSILNLRLAVFHEAWQTDLFYKSGAQDKFLFTISDPELALKERNYQMISLKENPFDQKKAKTSTDFYSSLYFYLTPLINEDDFRLEYLNQILQSFLFLR